MRAEANDREGEGGEREQQKASDLAPTLLRCGCSHRGLSGLYAVPRSNGGWSARMAATRESFVLDLTRCDDHNPLTLSQARPGDVCQKAGMNGRQSSVPG